MCKAWDEYCAGYQAQTVFFSPLRQRLPLGSGGHWKKVSDKRKLLWPRRKMPPLTLATPPIHDKDTKSSKESKLRQCHLWNEEGSIAVAIVNPIFPEILCIRPSVRRPRMCGELRNGNQRGRQQDGYHRWGPREPRLFQTITPCHLCEQFRTRSLTEGYPLCTHKSKWRYLYPSWSSQTRPGRTPFRLTSEISHYPWRRFVPSPRLISFCYIHDLYEKMYR